MGKRGIFDGSIATGRDGIFGGIYAGFQEGMFIYLATNSCLPSGNFT
jgi:hypothetical protein